MPHAAIGVGAAASGAVGIAGVAALALIDYQGTFTFGSLIIAIIVAASGISFRSAAAAARSRAETLADENADLHKRVSALTGRVDELSKATDLSPLLAAVEHLEAAKIGALERVEGKVDASIRVLERVERTLELTERAIGSAQQALELLVRDQGERRALRRS